MMTITQRSPRKNSHADWRTLFVRRFRVEARRSTADNENPVDSEVLDAAGTWLR